MSKLGTFFAWRTSVHTRDSSRTLRGMAQSGREAELRGRGWTQHSSLPEDYSAAEHTIAAQMRARREVRYGRRGEPFTGPVVVGVLLVAGGIVGVFAAETRQGSQSGLAVAVLAAVFCGVWAWQVARREARRRDALSRAVVTDGRCGWCGAAAPHMLEGEPTGPRVFHALEIELYVSPVPPSR